MIQINKLRIKKYKFSQTFPLIVLLFIISLRLADVSGIKNTLDTTILRPEPHTLLCTQNNEEPHDTAAGSQQPEPKPLTKYTNSIRTLPILSANLVVNNDFSEFNYEANAPEHFNRSQDSSEYTQLSLVSDFNDSYLQVTHANEHTPSAGWSLDPISLESGKTYLYSFKYRSNLTTKLNADIYTNAGVENKLIITLEPTTEWNTYSNYFKVPLDRGAVRFSFVLTGAGIGEVQTKAYTIQETISSSLEKGIVSITFDDGWQSIYDTALPILNAYGYPTTQYVVSDFIANPVVKDRYMTAKEVRKLAEQGHEIASHSYQHCDYSTMELNTVEYDSILSQKELQHISSPVVSFAYPYGHYSEQTQLVLSKTYPLIRTSDAGYNDLFFDHSNIRSFSVENTTTLKEFSDMVDYAEKQKVWVVFVYHHIGSEKSYAVTRDEFQKQIAKIHSSAIEVKTVSAAALTIEQYYLTLTK